MGQITFLYDEVTELYRIKMDEGKKKRNYVSEVILLAAGALLMAAAVSIALQNVSLEAYGLYLILAALTEGILTVIVETCQKRLAERMQKKAAAWKYWEVTLKPDGYNIKDLKTGTEVWGVPEEWKQIRETDEAFVFVQGFTLQKKFLSPDVIRSLHVWLQERQKERYENALTETAEEAEVGASALKIMIPAARQPDVKEYLKSSRRIFGEMTEVTVRMLRELGIKKRRKRHGAWYRWLPVLWCIWIGMQFIIYNKRSLWGIFAVFSLVYWYMIFMKEASLGIQICAGAAGRVFSKRDALKEIHISETEAEVIFENKKLQIHMKDVPYVMEGESYLKLGKKVIFQKSALAGGDLIKVRALLRQIFGSRYIITQDLSQPQWWRCAAAVFCLSFSIVLMLAPQTNQKLEKGIHAQGRLRQSNLYTQSAPDAGQESEEPGSGAETVQITGGIFREKVPDLSALCLGAAGIHLPDYYQDRVVNENTFLRIEGDTLYGSSYNQNGQLGLGDKEEHFDARGYCREYEIDTEVVSASVGESFIAYLKDDGTLYAVGEIPGQPEMLYKTVVLTDVIFADSGQTFLLALKKDGTVWILGTQGTEGRPEEPKASYPEFTKIFEGAQYATAGRYTAAVLLRDDSLWLWGDNTYGQCGKRAEPVCYTAGEAVRVAGKCDKVWLDKPEIDTGYQNIADPRVSDYVVLSNYRTYIRKKNGSMFVCGEGVTEDIFMKLKLTE